MRIELTIKTTYLPEWRAWEGIRELVQNAKDAETEHHAPMRVRHRAPDTLVIENEGVTLPHEALLLGFTSKQSRSDLIGKFGEGLKLGILALVRAHHTVKIRSGSEVWVPRIVRSEKFDAEVLAFDIHKGRKQEDRVQIEISHVSKEAWEAIQTKFLFLTKPKQSVDTWHGSLLLDPEQVGKVYVRGIFVCPTENAYGYNLAHVEIDRDRKMLDPFSLRHQICGIWSSALEARPDLVLEFKSLLERQAKDVEGFGEYEASKIPEAARSRIAADFVSKHGEKALPVGTLAESSELQHYGMVGVVCSSQLRALLEKNLGTFDHNRGKLRNSPSRSYGWHELSAQEQRTLRDCEDLAGGKVDEICDFRDAGLMGLFLDGRILLAKRVLSDRYETMQTLVHEVAHKAGGDGEKGHVEEIERIWSNIVKKLEAK